MDKAKLQKSTVGYSIATVGDLSTFEGKTFLKETLGTTAIELSLGTLAPGESVPFFHHHKQNEEVYIILSGTGIFYLDGNEETVSSGSIVRIAPEVSRNTRNTGNTPLIYICIQGKAKSLEQYTMTDGVVEQ
ncbi:MAG: cupin domain-containing protein [Prevotella sp.]